MKKKIYLIVLLISLLVSCTNKQKTETNNNRFEIIYKENGFTHSIYIIEDKKTNIKYLYYDGGYDGGITKLEE